MRSTWDQGLSSIHCLKQSGIAADDNNPFLPSDDDDPFLSSDDDDPFLHVPSDDDDPFLPSDHDEYESWSQTS